MNGADKAMLPLAGKPLIAHVIARAAPQVDELLINANEDPARFATFGHNVIADTQTGYLGPLAGMLACFEWVKENRTSAKWLVSFACDCPFMPGDLVNRLTEAARKAHVPVAIAASRRRHHPVFAALNTQLPLMSEDILHKRSLRKVDHLIEAFPNTRVEFETESIDPFFNINTPEDLAQAESFISESAHV
jgi:molybdopterin-guanine dinucleotide biosynthesis protein A